ncbi:MAG TPA: adenosylmethionine--8-amino-7-oxononanoate transaminase [Ohtaekwangia sp.]|uniref:adenosylmethionine--8-amino-7-oxononanoate transaminase n=1 Tax=Ohtaekwangia sp. TaxID=2066019 RepID=UPI002F924240
MDNLNLKELDKKNIWHPFTPLVGGVEPVMITAAEGVYLHTDDGRKIIDAVSSWWVNIHGHSNQTIAKAVAEQAGKLEHVIFAGFTHEPAIRLSKNLLSILPPNQSRIFFSDNGSTAVEVGLKMALQYWYNQGIPRKKIIAIDGAYHGDTFGSMSVGERGIFTNPFQSHLFETIFIDFPEAGREEHILEQFCELIEDGDVAAFIYEPLVQGAGGMRMYSASLLNDLLTEAQANDVICIADEVLTGFGRTGKYFASDYCLVKPDIMALSKGITGGTMPLGVTTCSDKIQEAFQTDDFLKTFFHGHSYTANPIACAAANASFNLLVAEECQQNIQRIASQHRAFASELLHHNAVATVRSLGTFLALEIKTDTKTSYENEIRKMIYPFFMERNVLLRPLGNIIYILPPYVITNEQLQEVYTVIRAFLDMLER